MLDYTKAYTTLYCGRFSKVHGLNVIPDPRIFELSEGILK